MPTQAVAPLGHGLRRGGAPPADGDSARSRECPLARPDDPGARAVPAMPSSAAAEVATQRRSIPRFSRRRAPQVPAWRRTTAGRRLAADRRRTARFRSPSFPQSRRPAAEHPAAAGAGRVGRRARAAATAPVEGERRTAQDRPAASGRADHRGLSRRRASSPRSGRQLQFSRTADNPDGVKTYIFRGGINLVTRTAKSGTIDIEADEAVIWRGPDRHKGRTVDRAQRRDLGRRRPAADGSLSRRQRDPAPGREQVRRQGRPADRPRPAAVLDFLTDRLLAPNAEIDMFAPSLLAPVKIKSPRIEQFRRPVPLPNGTFALAEQPEIRAEPAVMTGSRFPDPGYQLSSRSIDLTRHTRPLTNPDTGQARSRTPTSRRTGRRSTSGTFDARQNFYLAGPFPIFYWPRIIDGPRRPASRRCG